MKNFLLVNLIFILSLAVSPHTYGQFGVSVHFTNYSLAGFNYEIMDRLLPELRIGVRHNGLLLENVLLYEVINREDLKFLIGAGTRLSMRNKVLGYQIEYLMPAGVHYYPFPNRRVGFHIEAAPGISKVVVDIDRSEYGYEGSLRISGGIRYQFKK